MVSESTLGHQYVNAIQDLHNLAKKLVWVLNNPAFISSDRLFTKIYG